MPVSARYKDLRSRLRELRAHMLPSKFSPIGNYTERQLDRARGYRLLVHAEIESYLEDISRESVTNAIKVWKSNQKPSITIISFLASYHSSWNIDDETSHDEIIKIAKSRKNMNESVNEIVDLAQTQFTRRIKENHGIKDKNFKTLILPTGIDFSKLDQTWLTNLDNFGSKRGDVAHKSKTAHDTINPKDEYELVKKLLAGLLDLDREIIKIGKEIV